MTSQTWTTVDSPRLDDSQCVLDRATLNTLRSLLGDENTAAALQRFRSDLEQHVAAIAAEEADPSEMGARAHKLVGTAGAIGFQQLSETSRRLESAVKQNVPDLGPYLHLFLSAAEKAKSELNQLE